MCIDSEYPAGPVVAVADVARAPAHRPKPPALEESGRAPIPPRDRGGRRRQAIGGGRRRVDGCAVEWADRRRRKGPDDLRRRAAVDPAGPAGGRGPPAHRDIGLALASGQMLRLCDSTSTNRSTYMPEEIVTPGIFVARIRATSSSDDLYAWSRSSPNNRFRDWAL